MHGTKRTQIVLKEMKLQQQQKRVTHTKANEENINKFYVPTYIYI